MGSHPLNLVFRFLLEVLALILSGIWAWHLGDASFRYVLAIAVPLAMAVAWGVFAVPNDPSRSGKTVVKTKGWIRLLLELGFFGFAAWSSFQIGWQTLGWVFAACVLLHYIISYDRVRWLLFLLP